MFADKVAHPNHVRVTPSTQLPKEFFWCLTLTYVFFKCSSWGSHSKYTGVVGHPLLQWITFCRNSPLWPNHPGWPNAAWFIASLSHASPFTMTRQWSTKGEVKWASGSTTVNKAGGCNGILAELFKTLKEDAIQVLHSICQQIWKTQQCPRDWQRSILNPSQEG